MKIKRDYADEYFSRFIRLRDMECRRCHSRVRLNDTGLPISHTNSHYFGRGRENTRFDPENCDTLCTACHRLWASDEREDYRQFKINQLGQRGFDLLTLRASTYHKKDRKMALLQSRALLASLTTSD